MYEDVIVKHQVLTSEECKEIADYFLEKLKTHQPYKGHRGYGKNRLKFVAIDYQNKRTEWFPKVEEYRNRLAALFDLNTDDASTWISIFMPPCDLPMHVDPPIKDYIRLLVLLQRPEVGGEVVLAKKEHDEKTVLPLGVGDAYLLPAHKYYHGVTFLAEDQSPRIAIGFDYKSSV